MPVETVQPSVPSTVARPAFDALAVLHELALEAGHSDSRQQLVFRILNRTVRYCHYDRAALWLLSGRRPRLLGVSGQVDVAANAPLVADWRAALPALADRGDMQHITPRSATDDPLWSRLTQRTEGLSVVWVPLIVDGRPVAGLWLERWGTRAFSEQDLQKLQPLASSYAIAWRAVCGRTSPWQRWFTARRRWLLAACLAAVVALTLVPVPLRIVAPCEVVPQDPVAITATLNGVLDEVLVEPGRRVAEGELLAVYDKRVALEELRVAQQQVQIVESDLQRARVQAFDNPDARAQITLLDNRLAQERVRLRLAQQRAEKLEIRAPHAGTVMLDDAEQWRGRPVQVGERLLMLVDPQQTKLRIWLPEHDNIAFDRAQPLKIILDAAPHQQHHATLTYLANHSELNRQALPRFRAEATWADGQPAVKLGLQGSAVLYGDDVSLGYWLLRRPISFVRRWTGW
jgi:multidrug resistance efflux pump